MLTIGRPDLNNAESGNTLDALYATIRAGADILELTVAITIDAVPVVVHAPRNPKLHPSGRQISRLTFNELFEKYDDYPIVPLSQVLDEFFGVILLNIRLKGSGSGKIIEQLLKHRYITKRRDWDNIILSSFRAHDLIEIRKTNQNINLALLQSKNPFAFIAHYRQLKLTAVGFHRLYLNSFALEVARRAGLFTFVYTVNRPETAIKMAERDVDGIVTNRTEIIIKAIEKRG